MRPLRWLRQSGLCSGLPGRSGSSCQPNNLLRVYGGHPAPTRSIAISARLFGETFRREGRLNMSVATKPTTAQTQTTTRKIARIWHAPISRWLLIWLALCPVFYGGVLGWYIFAVRTQDFPGPSNDPLRLFGIFAFVLVLATAAFTLRRRFVRGLPGKVQNWLWMHIC